MKLAETDLFFIFKVMGSLFMVDGHFKVMAAIRWHAPYIYHIAICIITQQLLMPDYSNFRGRHKMFLFTKTLTLLVIIIIINEV